jgi:hypothetical protein
VRIRQDNNTQQDYEAVSVSSFAISAAGLTGDYNNDNVVDAGDYSVWRNAFGAPGSGLAADGNNNGQIDEGDYTVWRRHYGDSTAVGAAAGAVPTPEPSAWMLLVLPVGLGWHGRCRKPSY